MRLLITGGQGQLAADLTGAFAGIDIHALGRADLDITAPDAVRAAMNDLRPTVVINTAAYHDVDRCESEPEMSFAVNSAAVQRLAAASDAVGALFVHLSTDYVFGGTRHRPYVEDDPVDPISVYGASKAAGEMAIRVATGQHLIVRTTGLYGLAGRRTGRGNFVETMLRLAGRGKPINVVNDQTLTPSYTADVARRVAELVELGATGTYHVTSGGECSWYQFAAEIFRLAGARVNLYPTQQTDRPAPARRPSYSVLGHRKMETLGLPPMRHWQAALAEYMETRGQPLRPAIPRSTDGPT